MSELPDLSEVSESPAPASGSRPIRPADTRRGRYDWELARGQIHAFGEGKSLASWAQDDRCVVRRETLRTRLALGWPPERAITAAKHDTALPSYGHGGRELTLRGWAQLTGISYHALYHRMYRARMSLPEALQRGLGAGDPDGYGAPVSAFGERKPLYWWAVDVRAAVDTRTIRGRLDAGWNPQRAITEPPQYPGRRGQGAVREAFGRRMSLPDWGRLAGIPAQLLRARTADGTGLEDVLRAAGWYPAWIENQPDTLRVNAAGLRPGDHILAIDSPHPTPYTIRRTLTAPGRGRRRDGPSAPPTG